MNVVVITMSEQWMYKQGLRIINDTLSEAGNPQWCIFCWYYYMYLIAQCYGPPPHPPPPTEGEGHIVFAAVPIGFSVTLNICLISHEPLADSDSHQIYIDI